MTYLTQEKTNPTAAIAIATNTDQLLSLWLHGKAENTQKANRRIVNEFIAFTGYRANQTEIDITKQPITLNELQSYETALREAGQAINTVARKLAALKSLLTFSQKIGISQFNAGSLIKIKTDDSLLKERILTEKEVQSLVEATTSKRDYIMLKTLYLTGLRASELIGLTWDKIKSKEDGNAVITVTGKGDKTRSILIPSHLYLDLLSLKKDDHNSVFVSRHNNPICARQLDRIIKAAAAAAGLPDNVSAHWLRHCFVSHSLNNHAPIQLVQSAAGHASLTTTQRYCHIDETDSPAFYLTATGG